MARAAPESRQQARTIAYSLARALRALAGDLSRERLGRIALLGNASEILPKSLPETSREDHQEEQGESGEGRPRIETASALRPRRRFELGASRSHRVASRYLGNLSQVAPGSLPGPPGAHFGPPGAHVGPPGGHLGPPGGHLRPPGSHFGPPGAPGALPGRSREPLGSLLGPPKTSQNRSPRLSRRPPAPELEFEACWEPFWLHFGTPRSSKNKVFVWRVLHFSKNRGGSKKP